MDSELVQNTFFVLGFHRFSGLKVSAVILTFFFQNQCEIAITSLFTTLSCP